MSVKFDANAAERLIYQMDIYCTSLQKEALDLLDILELSGDWTDSQHKVFYEHIKEISGDLVKALKMQDSYIKIFSKRIKELRG